MNSLLYYYLFLLISLFLYVLVVILVRRKHKLKTIEDLFFLLGIIFALMWAVVGLYYKHNLDLGIKNRYVTRSLVDMSSGICLGVIICWFITKTDRKANWFKGN